MFPPNMDPNYNPVPILPKPETSFIVKYRPISNLSDSRNIEFQTTKSPDCVIDLSQTVLNFTFRITDKDGKALDTLLPKFHLALVNDYHSSLMNNISISINDQIVTQTNHFKYLSHLINNLNYTNDFKRSVLYTAGYIEESSGTVGLSTSASFKSSQERVAKSAEIFVSNKINSSLFLQKKALPINCQLGVSISISSAEQMVITNLETPVKLEITSAELLVRFVKVENSVLPALTTSLSTKPYNIPIVKTDLRVMNLPATLSTCSIPNLYMGTVPHRVLLLMVESSKLAGTFDSSCYEFGAFGLDFYEFTYNNISFPVHKCKFNAKTGDLVQLYNVVNNQLGIAGGSGYTPQITYEKFCKESFMIINNFNTDCSISQSTLPGTPGTLGLTLHFADPLAKNVSLICISEYSSSIIIDMKENSVKVV